jgi:hypothetical protein
MTSTERSSPPADLPAVGWWPLETSPYRYSCAQLLLMPLLASVWKVIVVPLPAVSLTVGRLLIVTTLVTAAVELWRGPRPPARPSRLAIAVGATTVALLAWIALSAATWGCRCASELAGFSELTAVAGLALAVAVLEPRVRAPLMVAAVAGAAVTAALSLAGIEGFTEGNRNLATAQGRLAGPIGNANYLGFALAIVLPAALVHRNVLRGRGRWIATLVLVGTTIAAVLTFSRGGLLALAAGLLAVGVLGAADRRARLHVLGGFGLLALVAAFAYPVFVDSRRAANTVDPSPALKSVDTSGWDTRERGLIGGGPAVMRNSAPGVLQVETSAPREGVSFPWGPAERGRAYDLSFRARADPPAQLGYGLEDARLANGAVAATGRVVQEWRAFRLRWRPTGTSPDARLYVWKHDRAGSFELRDVTITEPGAPAGSPMNVAMTLQGSVFARERARRIREKERRDIESRRVGLELAFQAFADDPVRGIGWGDFPAYSDRRAPLGPLVTHDEYLRFLAELGLVGVSLLAALMALLVVAAARMPRDALGVAASGVLASGAVGLLFINGLVASQVSLPLAFAGALCCARVVADPAELGRWWPSTKLPRRGVI